LEILEMKRMARAAFAPILMISAMNVMGQNPDRPDKPERADKVSRPMRGARGLDKIDPRKMKEELTSSLNLDAAQQSDADRILKAHQQKLSDLRKEYPVSEEMVQKMTKIREDLKTAREAKDQAKIEELAGQMRTIRADDEQRKLPMRKAQEDARQALKGELMAILHDDQKAKFDTYWSEKMDVSRDRYAGPARSPQALKAIVDRLAGITTDQKSQMDILFKQYFEASRTTTGNQAANDAQVKKLYDDVLNVLTPEQRQQAEQKLKGGQRTSARREQHKSPGEPGAQPKAPNGG
jgi:hypothetical protein